MTAVLVSALAFFAEREAKAQATTGLWPDLSTPPQGAPAEPSEDAALIIGIDRYDALPRVQGAADNARDWEKYFLLRRNVAPDRVQLLTDQNATAEAIVARAKALTAKLDEKATLFVIFIGHGAPSDGGKKGILLGADVRPSDASFGSRGVAYDDLRELLKTGKQGRTVMILDACFSGVSNQGKTLLPSVQPVVATNLLTSSAMTVFSAGSAAEYAGALPGSLRPALSYLMLGALRGWADTDADGKITASEAQEYTSRVLRSLPNNHEQHPQIVTDTDDVLLERGAKERPPSLATIRSQLDTWKPPVEAGPAQPKLRVAVTCDGDEPVSAEGGLALYVDGSPTALAADGGKQTKDVTTGNAKLEYVSFTVAPGPHDAVVRIPGCRVMKTSFVAREDAGVDIRGALESEERSFVRGPSGTPDGLRIGLGLWLPTTRFSEGYGLGPEIAAEARPAYEGLKMRLGGAGATVHGGYVGRWFHVLGELGLASLGATVLEEPNNPNPAVRKSLDEVSVTWMRAVARVGPRLPLGRAAVGINIGAGLDGFIVGGAPAGLRIAEGGTVVPFLSFGLLVDVHVTCDFPVFVGASLDSPFADGLSNFAASAKLGVAFQPNRSCRRDQRTTYGLTARDGKGKP